ncbi:MAG: DNA N-6-adenine-methyltransferase [Candidatus Babeliales bacterium]|jgi:site-specific DNA-methyltransferase (adenine-specific)
MIENLLKMVRSFKSLFSSNSQDWRTPSSIYNALNNEFDFNFDPCPTLCDKCSLRQPKYKSCSNHLPPQLICHTAKFDGLTVDWKEQNFINPPYKNVAEWIKKGYEESLKGKLCVFLVASRTDTRWFQDYCLPYAKEIRFIKGRLRFGDSKNSAPFASVVVVFDGRSVK